MLLQEWIEMLFSQSLKGKIHFESNRDFKRRRLLSVTSTDKARTLLLEKGWQIVLTAKLPVCLYDGEQDIDVMKSGLMELCEKLWSQENWLLLQEESADSVSFTAMIAPIFSDNQ